MDLNSIFLAQFEKLFPTFITDLIKNNWLYRRFTYSNNVTIPTYDFLLKVRLYKQGENVVAQNI
jgi:hypothetical protein